MKKLIHAVLKKTGFCALDNAKARIGNGYASAILARYYKGIGGDCDNMVIVYEKTDTGSLLKNE